MHNSPLQSQIKLESLSEKEISEHENLNQQPYGETLALQVSLKLEEEKYEGWGLYHSHTDYCGLGLFFVKKIYAMGAVHDGYGPMPALVTFNEQLDFTAWLSLENDQSMAMYGERFNYKTLSKVRLEWFLEDDYTPVWDDFCLYLDNKNTEK